MSLVSGQGTGDKAVAKSEVFQCKNGTPSYFLNFYLHILQCTHCVRDVKLIPPARGGYLKVQGSVNFTCPLTSMDVANSQQMLAEFRSLLQQFRLSGRLDHPCKGCTYGRMKRGITALQNSHDHILENVVFLSPEASLL